MTDLERVLARLDVVASYGEQLARIEQGQQQIRESQDRLQEAHAKTDKRISAIEQALGLGPHSRIPEDGILVELRRSRDERKQNKTALEGISTRLTIMEERDNMSKSAALWKILGTLFMGLLLFLAGTAWEGWAPKPTLVTTPQTPVPNVKRRPQ